MNYAHSNGFFYTQEDVEEAARKRNMSVDEYLRQTPELSVEGKVQGLAVDPTPSQDAMGSSLVDGGSEQPETNLYDSGWGWGDFIKRSAFGKSIRSRLPGSSLASVLAEDAIYEAEQLKRKKDEDWKAQSVDFNKNLDDLFADPEMFQKILGDEETLQNRAEEAGHFGNPAEYLQDIIQKQVGGFGIIGERKVDPTTGMPVYSKLTNSDMNSLLMEKFNAKLYEEQTNVNNGRQTKRKKALQNQNISLEDYWEDDSKSVMSEFTGDDKKLAELYREIKTGGLNEVDRIKKVKEFTDLREKDDKRHMVIDPITGFVRVATDDAHRDKLQQSGHVPLNIGEKQKQYEDIITDYDRLKQEYQRSTLALGGLNDELEVMRTAEYDNPAYLSLSSKEKATTDIPKRITVSKSVKDWVNSSQANIVFEDGQSQEDWLEEKARLRSDIVHYNADHEALKRMYFLNEGVRDQDISALDHLETSAASLLTPFIGEYNTDRLLGGQTDRVILDKIGEKYNQLGFEMSKEDEKYLERNVGEMVNEGFFGSGRMLAEFYGLNKFLKPVQMATGFSKFMNGLQAGRWVKNGKTFTDASMKARAAKRGMDVDAYVASLGDRVIKGKKGFEGARFLKSSTRDKGIHTLLTGGVEAGKFEAITAFDTGEFGEGLATGFGFGVGGRMLAPLAPLMKKKGLLKDFDKIGANVNTRKLFETFVTQPASFVVGSEFGETMNAVVDDALGNKEFADYMEEHYGDYGEVGKRLITNQFIGLGFGMGHFKGFADYKSKAGLQKMRRKAMTKMKEGAIAAGVDKKMIDRAGKKGIWSEEIQNKIHEELSEKDLKNYYKHWEVLTDANTRINNIHRAEGYMDPSRADEMVKNDMRDYIKQQKDNHGIDVRVEVVNNKRLRFGQKAIKDNADVMEMPGTNGKVKLFRFNAEAYTPDIKAHEISHDYFESSFTKDAIFKGEFMNKLGSIADKMLLERDVTESEAKKLGNEGRTGEQMTLHEAIKLEYPTFDLKDAVKNQRIQQWELFSHIAENIGNNRHYNAVNKSNGYLGLRNLISDFGKRANQKYDLSQEKDIVRWFRDYSKNIKKGINQQPMFDKLESVIDLEATAVQAAEASARQQRVERGYESKNLEAQKNTFLDNQRKSIEEGKDTPLYSLDKHLFKGDGTLKYKTLNEFKANSTDYAGAWQKIFGERGIFDTQIKQGMTAKGVPEGEPMQTFVNKVKDNLLRRFNENFNPQEGGGSLYGYFGKVAVPYEKLRVQEQYKKSVEGKQTTLDKLGEMQAPTEARVKRFETENILEQQFREAKGEKTTSEEGRIFSEMMGRDKSGVQTKITEATKKQKIDLDKTKPIYKTLKKWLTEVELIERDGKKVKPTKEADVKPLGVLSEVMKVVSAEYGVPLKRLLANQTLDGKMRDKARDYIKNKVTEIRKGVFPEGETPSGIATGAANTSWKSLYEFKGKRGEFAKGKTAAGKEVVEKRADINNAEILEKVGINPKTGEYAKGTKFDSAIKELIKFDATIEAKQALTTLGRGIFSDSAIGEMGAGRPRGMASKNLEKQSFKDQVNFLSSVQSKTFNKMFKRNMKSIDDPVKAINKTLIEYFTDYKARGNEFNISNADLKTIGKELHKEYKFTKLTPTKIASKAAKAITMPNDLRSIDIKAGLEPTPFTLNTLSDLVEARAVTRVVAKALVEKYGDGVYEAMLLRGESGGKGVGTFGSIAEMVTELKKGQNRFSLHEASEAAIDFMSDIINSKGKKYSGPTSTMIEGQGNKAGQMRRLIDKKTGEWNKKALNEAYETGEFNKKVLKDAVQALRKAYEKEDITHTQARQWVEIHGGSMSGLVKLAGSFAVVPNMSPKQMFKLYPEMVEKIGKDGKKKMVSNYVLEHTTPAQFVKARIYDYIINGGEAKKSAMDLTLKDYHTTLIPEKFDVMVNKTLQTDLPSWHLPGMDPISSRYYEANHPSDFGFGLRNFKTGKVYDYNPSLTEKQKQKLGKQLGEINKKLFPKGLRKAAERKLNSENLEDLSVTDKALELGRKRKKKAKGMSTFDFDETLINKGENFIIAREPNTGKKVKISSGKWPIEGPKFAEQGYTFDFKDFVKVRGGIEGPMFKKFKERIAKFGPENMFVLTARPPEAATAIYGWLKSKGVKIPFENITGLGNSTGEAKAMWMLKKFSEGYNDMYFVDDAMPNVKAVKNVLSQLDIKSKVQQALASKDLNKDVNNMMEYSLGIGSEKVFSKAEGKIRGKDIKRRRVFMRDSAADLELLIEPLYGKGKKGIENKKWFKKEFVMPFERGIRDYNTARQSAKSDYMNLRKRNKDIVKDISKEVEGTTFTNDMAMRVYLWNKAGYKIPDLAKATETKLVKHIQSNPKLQAYAETFAKITKQEKGLKEPGQNWWAETMAGEVTNVNRGVSRKQFLQEWIDVKNEIFTEANLNKMESKLGTRWRENIEDMFDRMETGRTRSLKMDRGSAMMMNYLNGSIGSIMNFNTRSAALQTISTVNFLNMRENNPIAAAKAMGNTKQFVKDFKYIMNSDMLKQRRDGLAMNVTEAELASAAEGSKNPIQSMIAKVLKHGYLPTKMADSFAISFGGATFYRNRAKMYEKQGMKTKEAEKQAWLDFQVLSERTQQSSRADLLSKQQTSLIGRFILPFANTPMQMNRAGMKDMLDISKGRYKNKTELAEKMGRITYYMGAQIALFAGLQSGMFALMLNEDDVPEKTVERAKTYALGSTTDSFLRGFGVQGAVLAALKNATIEYAKQSKKPGFTADYAEVGEALLNISPPIGSKFGKLDRAGDMKKWAKIRKDDDFKFELGNPSLQAALLTVEAITNAPLHGWHQNAFNIQHALSDDYEMWQRAHMLGGWTPFQVGIETEDKKKKKKKKDDGPKVYPW